MNDLANIHESKKWVMDGKIERTLTALKRNGFKTIFVQNRRDALESLLKLIPSKARVGVGGSITVRELGTIEALVARGNTVAQHWLAPTPQESEKKMKEEMSSEIYVTSVNAVTEDGKIVNTDDTGNRIAAMIFGPPQVILVAGVNKIVKDVNEGFQRVRNVAAPMNSKRLKLKTPCAITGLCTDCESPERICRVSAIIERRPRKTDITMILVGEDLGF